MKDVKTHESEFIEKYRKCSVKEMRSVRLSAQTKIVKAENRIKTLDDIIANLYEDNVTGKISDERFETVYSFDKAHSTLQGGTSNKEKNEKLFMVKNS